MKTNFFKTESAGQTVANFDWKLKTKNSNEVVSKTPVCLPKITNFKAWMNINGIL